MDCKDCKKCLERSPKKCCECLYMYIDEWEGWKCCCYLHDIFCDEIEQDGCEDFAKEK